MLKTVVEQLQKDAGGKLEFSQVEPKTENEMLDLFKRYGMRPYADLFSGKTHYFHLLMTIGDRKVLVVPPDSLGEAGLKTSILDGLKRAAPGFTRVVGMVVPAGGPPMNIPGMPPQGQQPPQSFNALRKQLSGNYEVRDVSLGARVPDDIEVLVLCGPATLDAKAAENVDQFVMRGGSLVALVGRYRLQQSENLSTEKVVTGLEAQWLAWGVTVGDQMVLDAKGDVFPMPRTRDVGNGLKIREYEVADSPFAPKIEKGRLSSSIITDGLPGAVMHFAAPIDAKDKVGEDTRVVDILLESSSESWLTTSTAIDKVEPGAADERKTRTIGVSLMGGFATSLAKPEAGKPPADSSSARRLEHSPPDTRMVIFGSSAFASDEILQVAQQIGSPLAASNLQLVHNAVDWAVADTDLLAIRGRTSEARALTVEKSSINNWRLVNIVVAGLGLALVIGLAIYRRNSVIPVIAKEGGR
jgi:hypothetical protein